MQAAEQRSELSPGRVGEPWVNVKTSPELRSSGRVPLPEFSHISLIACAINSHFAFRRTITSSPVAAPQLGPLSGRIPRARRLALGLALSAAPQLGPTKLKLKPHSQLPFASWQHLFTCAKREVGVRGGGFDCGRVLTIQNIEELKQHVQLEALA